jgi:hypothetical protein
MDDKSPSGTSGNTGTPPAESAGSVRQAETREVLREAEALLGRRIDALERDYDVVRSRLRVTLGALAALFLVTVILAVVAAPRDLGIVRSVQSNQFVLRDESGLVRGVLEMNSAAGPRLVLRDGDGRDRIRLALLQDGSPGITLTDRDGQARAVLGVLPDGTTNLVFADATGRSRAVLGHTSGEATTLVLADREGFTRAGLVVDPSGEGTLTLWERGVEPDPATDPAAPGAN